MAFNTKSRTENSKKNAVSSFRNKMIILALQLVCRRFFIHHIGVQYLGINGLFANILTLLSLADLGVGTAMNVSLYKPIAEKDTLKLTALMTYFRKLYLWIALAVTFVGLGLTPFLKYIINLSKPIPWSEIYLYYLVFVVKSAVSYLFVYKSSIIRADQKRYLVMDIEVYVSIIKFVLKIISIILFKSYLVYILLDVAGVLAHNMIVSHIAGKQYPFIREKRSLEKTERRKIFSDISSIFLYRVSFTLLNGTDNILMSILVATEMVGLYSNYSIVTAEIVSLVALLFTSLTASVGNLVTTSSEQQRYKTFKTMQMVSFWLCGVVVLGLFFLMQDFIVIWVGKKHLLDDMTLLAIVLNTFFSICMRPVWTFREGTGMYRQIRFVMLFTAALNLVLSVVLGKLMGISGILFATSISKLCTYFWYEPYILFRDFFHRSARDYYLNYLVNTLMVIVIGSICYAALHWIPGTTIPMWLVKAAICMIIVNTGYFFYYRNTAEFADIKKRAMSILRRHGNKKTAV